VAEADADEQEGDGELVGQPFEMVRHLAAVAAVHVQEVDVIDHDETGLARRHTVRGPVGQLGGVAPLGAGVAVEAAQHRVEAAHRGVRRQPDPRHRDPFVALGGGRPVDVDLAAVEPGREHDRQGGLAQPGVGVEQCRALHLVTVLAVGLDDLIQLGDQAVHLRGQDRAQVGVPHGPLLLVAQPLRPGQLADGCLGELVGPSPGGGVDPGQPPLLHRQAVVALEAFEVGHRMTGKASS
jgi:hypothetical protein